ncbi:hypothetical protein B6D60_00510 [candidate division KSB1 bacterium 4484_87]|nr:MAG: hypothetical protein B6D60_00510 [candidate division KSB1 bacterium 4484_87]
MKRYLTIFLVLMLALVIILGCDKDNGTEPEEVDEFALVAEKGDTYFSNYTTPSGLPVNTSISAVYDVLTDGNTANDPFIIDYRSATDFASGHIKGAMNMALGDLVDKVDDGTIPKDKVILNICYTGQSASVATAVLNLLGYDAQNLLFGMCAVDTSISNTSQWMNQVASDEHFNDLETTANTTTTTYEFPKLNTGETEAEAIIKARFKEVIAPGWPKISADDVWDNTGNYFIANYWPENEYLNPGHIPGAYQFTPKTSLKTDAQLNLLPADKTIVVYCYTGQTSAQVATYLKILGYDAKSLLYGFNGFAYSKLGAHKYAGPPQPGIYDAILEKP